MNVEFPIQLTPFTYRTPKKSNSVRRWLSDQLLPVISGHHTVGEGRWAARFLPLNTVLGLKLGKGRGEDCLLVLVNDGDITHRVLHLHHPPPILMMPKSTV